MTNTLLLPLPDDIVYNQSMVGGMNTVDKRHINEELGYIAPPNRKLPPVPGSNYNTCDRIKRGTSISKAAHFIHLPPARGGGILFGMACLCSPY